MDRDEAMLVAQAAELGFDDFYRVLDYWKQMADPDGADASEEERKASRNVYLETSFCRACGWARSPWTPSRARSWPPSSTA